MSLDNPTFSERLAWRLEVLAYDCAAGLLGLLPLDAASALGGWLMRRLGPLTGADHVMRVNLELVFPDWRQAERDRVRMASWEEFGRFAVEFTMMQRLTMASGRITVVGAERLKTIAEGGKPALMISGHFSNFEIMASAIVGSGVHCQVSYRPANNPHFDERVIRARARYGVTSLAPKGAAGARHIIRALSHGESVAMLIDQKFNAGVEAPFFGHLAHTSPGPVKLARRYGGQVTPMSVRRLKGARFEMTLYEPIVIPVTEDEAADTEVGVRLLNQFLEERIRAYPEAWFWAHRRWPKSLYKKDKQSVS